MVAIKKYYTSLISQTFALRAAALVTAAFMCTSVSAQDLSARSGAGLNWNNAQSSQIVSRSLSLDLGLIDANLTATNLSLAQRPLVESQFVLGSGWRGRIGYAGAAVNQISALNGFGSNYNPNVRPLGTIGNANSSALNDAQMILGVQSQHFGLAYIRPITYPAYATGHWSVGVVQARAQLALADVYSPLSRWTVGAKLTHQWAPDLVGAMSTNTVLSLSAERRFGVSDGLRMGISYSMSALNQSALQRGNYWTQNADGTGLRAVSSSISLHVSKSF